MSDVHVHADDSRAMEHLDGASFAHFVPAGVFARLREAVKRLPGAAAHRKRLDALAHDLDTVD